MIFALFVVIILFIFILGYVIKKECFDEGNPNNNEHNQKYTITEISKSVDVLLRSLQDTYSLLKVHKVKKSSPYLDFSCMLYNHQHPSVKNFDAKVKLPLSSKGEYVLESASTTDSKEVIENGSRSIRDSQSYSSFKT